MESHMKNEHNNIASMLQIIKIDFIELKFLIKRIEFFKLIIFRQLYRLVCKKEMYDLKERN